MDQETGNDAGSAEPGYREKFPPTSGRVVGVVAVLFSATLLGYALLDRDGGFGAPVVWGAAFFGLLSYAALLRPAVRIEADVLVLRNMIDTNVVPLASVDEVVVRQVLAVRAGDKRYVSPAIGTSFMRTIRPRNSEATVLTYPDYVRDRILHLADGARRRRESDDVPAARRLLAWPEIAGLVITGVGFVVSLLV